MIWLIGSGPMAIEYYKVLSEMNLSVSVIGRSTASAEAFKDATQKDVITGGLARHIDQQPLVPDAAIVSVSVDQLASTTITLISYGVKKILLEKPGGISSEEITELAEYAEKYNASVVIAYNRRQYASVEKAKEMIKEDGGVTSFNFEITEWSHVIKNHQKNAKIMETWFIGNTTHVIDTAFYLGGIPKDIAAISKGSLPWHPASSNYVGSGISDSGALFSYRGNWESPGRWGIELLTRKRKYILCPMEQLHIQEIGSISVEKVDIDDSLDISFKPGLYKQVQGFLDNDLDNFCDLKTQTKMIKLYEEMAGYEKC